MNKVLYVGYPSFPKGLAQVQRQLLIAKGLVEQGCQVLVLNQYGTHNKNVDYHIKTTGIFEGVDYIYCSGTPFRPDNFIQRNLLKIKGFFVEIKTIVTERFKNKANTIIITSNSFRGVFFYTLIAKILNITSVVDQVEYWSEHQSGKKRRIDSYLNDRYYGLLSDRVIVISNFLLSKLKENQPKTPVIKIPAICDFSKFVNHSAKSDRTQYFLFCGSAAYFEVIKFIVDSYARVVSQAALILVISGEKVWIDRVNNYIDEKNIKKISIKSNIEYSELVSLYKNSLALLIPLRPSIQDIARFPHKLGEYTASKRPIISTNIGEVKVYFRDGINAFLSDSYEIGSFSKKMQEAVDFSNKREEIAHQSFETGEKEFSYQKNMARLYQFLFKN